ncbi:hypothetical protein HYW41_03090 [Candidatus Daviesbacteria bacterium]|nr:hypothetical protein [Candidatus Daviesbacteria bacterium]
MSYLPFTILAYLLNSIAVTIDKFLLAKSIPNPLSYVIYISLFSLLILLALPFTPIPNSYTLLLASVSTILWTSGAYFMFAAIKIGQVSKVVPTIGTFVPLLLLIHAAIFSSISQTQLAAVAVLILGLITLNSHTLIRSYICMGTNTSGEGTKPLLGGELLLGILSALLFAVSYLVLRQAYLESNFLTVLVYSRIILIPLILSILVIPSLRKIVLSSNNHSVIQGGKKTGFLFLFGQALGGTQQLLLTYAISLTSPALVNSLQGIQYVFLFLFSLWLFKEKYSFLILLSKLAGIGLLGVGLYLLVS